LYPEKEELSCSGRYNNLQILCCFPWFFKGHPFSSTGIGQISAYHPGDREARALKSSRVRRKLSGMG
jgi:hypothetical protein